MTLTFNLPKKCKECNFTKVNIIVMSSITSISMLTLLHQIDFFLGGGVGGRGVVAGGSEHNIQMFKMALLLFKEYKCAKLFRNR